MVREVEDIDPGQFAVTLGFKIEVSTLNQIRKECILLEKTAMQRISEELLKRMMEGEPIERIHVSVENEEFAYEFD